MTNYLAPSLSLLTAIFYLVATVGFAKKAKWACWVSIVSLGLETLCTFIVGGLSLTPAYADLIAAPPGAPLGSTTAICRWSNR